MNKIRFFCICTFFLLLRSFVFSEHKIEKITITERADYSVYKNGRYVGLTSRESKLYLNVFSDNLDLLKYIGEAFVLQKTKHNLKKVASSIDSVLPIEFVLDLNNDDPENPYQPQKFSKDFGYPLFRNFPILPSREFSSQDIGRKWEGKSTISVKPKSETFSTRIPVYVEFEYNGITKYHSKKVHHIKAQFGLRYSGSDDLGDPDLVKSQGGRKVDIYLDLNNKPVFIREKIDEEFLYSDGNKIRHRGFLLHFYSIIETGDGIKNKNGSGNGLDQIDSNLTIQDSDDFSVTKTDRGTVLNLNNLHFEADSAILLAGEEAKLTKIAEILKNVKSDFFMIEGHTADIGNYEGQKKLSIERAKTIAEKLIQLGVPTDKIMYSGCGGEKPIASNETLEGRAKNRRVEITIF